MSIYIAPHFIIFVAIETCAATAGVFRKLIQVASNWSKNVWKICVFWQKQLLKWFRGSRESPVAVIPFKRTITSNLFEISRCLRSCRPSARFDPWSQNFPNLHGGANKIIFVLFDAAYMCYTIRIFEKVLRFYRKARNDSLKTARPDLVSMHLRPRATSPFNN